MVILRYCYGLSRRDAGHLPGWERALLVDAGERILGIGADAERQHAASESGFTPDEYDVLMGTGG